MEISLHFLVTWLLINLAALISPGPDFVYITCVSLKNRRYGVISGLGIACALVIWVWVIGLGLAQVINNSHGLVFTAIMCAGLAYLTYLGVNIVRAAHAQRRLLKADQADLSIYKMDEQEEKLSDWACFVRGFICNITNVKCVFFMMAIISSFNLPSEFGELWHTLMFMSLSLFFLNAIYWSSLAVFVSFLAQKFATPSFRNKIELGAGYLLLVIVAVLAYNAFFA